MYNCTDMFRKYKIFLVAYLVVLFLFINWTLTWSGRGGGSTNKSQRVMTIDELKIQLESRQDLHFLRDELCKYLDENSFTTTAEQRERVTLTTFDPFKPVNSS